MQQTPIDLEDADRVSLASGVGVMASSLVDRQTDREIYVNDSAARCLARLDGSRSVAQVAHETAEEYDVDEETARRDLRDLITALDRHALVVVRKSLRGRLTVPALTANVLGHLRLDWFDQPARRYAPTCPSLVLAVLRSGRSGFAGACLTSIVLFLVLLPGAGSGSRSAGELALFATVPAILYAILIVQLFAHEAGHLLVLRRLTSATYYIAVRGLALSVAHTGAGPSERRVVALAGPLCGVASGVLMTAIALGAGVGATEALLPLLLSLAHVYSLMPWAADGSMIFGRRREV